MVVIIDSDTEEPKESDAKCATCSGAKKKKAGDDADADPKQGSFADRTSSFRQSDNVVDMRPGSDLSDAERARINAAADKTWEDHTTQWRQDQLEHYGTWDNYSAAQAARAAQYQRDLSDNITPAESQEIFDRSGVPGGLDNPSYFDEFSRRNAEARADVLSRRPK